MAPNRSSAPIGPTIGGMIATACLAVSLTSPARSPARCVASEAPTMTPTLASGRIAARRCVIRWRNVVRVATGAQSARDPGLSRGGPLRPHVG